MKQTTRAVRPEVPPVLLLHLSDLHFGPHGRFSGEDAEHLGVEFHLALAAAQQEMGLARQVDLVIVTGDIAEAGKRSELMSGCRFLTAVAGGLGLPASRFVFVPGNHDINWDACIAGEAQLRMEEALTEERLRSRLNEVKLGFYLDFLKRFYNVTDLSQVAEPLGFGAYLYRYPQLRLAVAAINSCEKESHRKDDHVGCVGIDQAEALGAALGRADLASWLKVLAVHHNPVATIRANLDAWREFLLEQGALDASLLERYESDAIGFQGSERLRAVAENARVQLVLHGHHHAQDHQVWPWRRHGSAHLLSAGSLLLKPGVLPKDQPASARLILLDPMQERLCACSLVYVAWHRVEGSVQRGGFAADPAGPIDQRLDLPAGYFTAAATVPQAQRPARDVEFLAAFRQQLQDVYSRWDIGSLGAIRPGGAQGQDATLAAMYVELRFALAAPEGTEQNSVPLRAEDLLSRDRPLVLRGAAGTGKTTWARYSFGRLLADPQALPVMLVLRDVARLWRRPECHGEARSIEAALDSWIGGQMGRGWQGRLANLLAAKEGPRPVLLVDGWDEAGTLGSELRGKLLGFLRRHSRVLAVVTSRPYGNEPPSDSEGFQLLDVQPLSPSDIEDLAGRFFRRFAASGEAAADRDRERFLEALRRSPEASDLARTPLLLTMMLLVGLSQPLPDKRHLLYEKCIEALLGVRPEQKAAEGALAGRHVWPPPGIVEGYRWTAALAHGVQTEGYQRVARAPIVRTWEEMLQMLPEDCPAEHRSGFLAWLVEVAGLLAERADGTLAFAHLSFQEYLTARHLETTAADAAGRRAIFERGLHHSDWWETLRLLAAQIGARNLDFLDQVLEGLLESLSLDKRMAFVGTVFADGLGSARLFSDWQSSWLDLLPRIWPAGAGQCAQVWRTAQESLRRSMLGAAIAQTAPHQRWLGWIRLAVFAWEPLALPQGSIARSLVEVAASQSLDAVSIAGGRVLCGATPAWATADHEIGLLQVWPSRRRLLGCKLQSALAAGASVEELPALAAGLSQQAGEPRAATRDVARDLARDLARSLSRTLARAWARALPRDSAFGSARELALASARDVARNLARDLAHAWTRDWARDWARDLASDLASDWARTWARDLARNWAPAWGRHMALGGPRVLVRDWTRDLAFDGDRDWGRELARAWGREWARTWACDLKDFLARRAVAAPPGWEPGDPAVTSGSAHHSVGSGRQWIDDFAQIEVASLARSTQRAFLVAGESVPESATPDALIATACRVSFQSDSKAALSIPRDLPYDPLWPAFARHIARQSTPDDRLLLDRLARHPEERQPPLQWGLRFIVRGDLLLEGGSFLTLDEVTAPAGLAPLPYLDDMEPELEVDWDDDRALTDP